MDPLNQTMPPAPMSPPGVPGAQEASTSGGSELSQEQMRGNLQELMSKIEGKYQDFNSQKFSSENKVKEMESETLRQIFDLLESRGVDPSNIDEVKAFLEKIKTSDPELSQRLEEALKSVLGEEDLSVPSDQVPPAPIGEGEAGVVPPENMNINTNETPQQNL